MQRSFRPLLGKEEETLAGTKCTAGLVLKIFKDMNEEPHSPERRYKLVAPYLTSQDRGSSEGLVGLNFTPIWVFHEGPPLCDGMMFSTDKDDMLRVMAPSVIIEDFFEDITMTLCQIVSNNSSDQVDDTARELWYMFSAGPG